MKRILSAVMSASDPKPTLAAAVPYGFYTFLRLVVCAATAFLAYREWTVGSAVTAWMVALGALALLFNPLLPVHLTPTSPTKTLRGR